MLSESECDGCPEYNKDNPQKPAICEATGRYIRNMEACPHDEPKEEEKPCK
jgi:hypothetical protein